MNIIFGCYLINYSSARIRSTYDCNHVASHVTMFRPMTVLARSDLLGLLGINVSSKVLGKCSELFRLC